MLQASPEFKGIKTKTLRLPVALQSRFKPALNSKGLRPMRCSLYLHDFSLQASPEFKGIKTSLKDEQKKTRRLQASPEFKGIKTRLIVCFDFHVTLQASPEFKGIKTKN